MRSMIAGPDSRKGINAKRCRSLRWVPIVLMASVAWFACAREAPSPKPATIAIVNGEVITMDRFNTALNTLTSGQAPGTSPSDVNILRQETLDQLIERTILLQEAKYRGIKVPEAEILWTLEQMKGAYPETEFNELIKNSGFTPESWKQNVAETLLIDKLLETAIVHKPTVSEEAVHSYYKKNRAEFQRKEEVRARQIVVDTEEEANILRQQILAGGDFADLANEKSVSPDAAQGGDLGFFSKGQMPEEFDIVFSLKISAVSPVVKSPYGYHIFQLVESRPPRFQPVEEVRDIIYQNLIDQQEDQYRAQWIKELKSKAEIQINASLLLKQDEPQEK